VAPVPLGEVVSGLWGFVRIAGLGELANGVWNDDFIMEPRTKKEPVRPRRQRNDARPEASGIFTGYSREYRPLPGYAALVGIYLAGFSLALLAAKKRRRHLPERIPMQDIALLGLATHKLSRFVSKDRVMTPVRAPFVTFEESEGSGELTENSRGGGMRKAVGDLLTCPYCLAVWIGTSLYSGFLFWPRLTRVIASVFSTVAISDLLHHVHFGAKEKKAE
jgi:hypothetical protein